MTTDTMRQKFEKEITRPIYGLGSYPSDREISLMWEMFQIGIKQGQRDLIEAMGEPVAYQHAWNKTRIAIKPVAVGQWLPLYSIPEDTTK